MAAQHRGLFPPGREPLQTEGLFRDPNRVSVQPRFSALLPVFETGTRSKNVRHRWLRAPATKILKFCRTGLSTEGLFLSSEARAEGAEA